MGEWRIWGAQKMIRKRPHHAFTLIELLVVVAVIGLLIGLLIPALSAARQSAWRVACASNQRQIVVASIAYETDHDGWAVPTRNLPEDHPELALVPDVMVDRYRAYSLRLGSFSRSMDLVYTLRRAVSDQEEPTWENHGWLHHLGYFGENSKSVYYCPSQQAEAFTEASFEGNWMETLQPRLTREGEFDTANDPEETGFIRSGYIFNPQRGPAEFDAPYNDPNYREKATERYFRIVNQYGSAIGDAVARLEFRIRTNQRDSTRPRDAVVTIDVQTASGAVLPTARTRSHLGGAGIVYALADGSAAFKRRSDLLSTLDRTDLGFTTISFTEERSVIPTAIEKVNNYEMFLHDFVNDTTFWIDETGPPAP